MQFEAAVRFIPYRGFFALPLFLLIAKWRSAILL
jgi:hypothetical protein